MGVGAHALAGSRDERGNENQPLSGVSILEPCHRPVPQGAPSGKYLHLSVEPPQEPVCHHRECEQPLPADWA